MDAGADAPLYRSASSSSGRGCCVAASISWRYFSICSWSTCTSGGARAGAATNSYAGVRCQ